MEVKEERNDFQKGIDILINLVGMVMIVYVTAYFFIALTD